MPSAEIIDQNSIAANLAAREKEPFAIKGPVKVENLARIE